MKWTALTLAAAVAVTSTSAFSPTPASFQSSFVAKNKKMSSTANLSFAGNLPHTSSTSLRAAPTMSAGGALTVGIVGATGAVGKEIRTCLETRKFPVETLRIFGSERSAGSKVDTEYGEVTVELFDVAKARECDVVFLAVSGDFALEHAKAITEGDGAVVIDNSVSYSRGETHTRLTLFAYTVDLVIELVPCIAPCV